MNKFMKALSIALCLCTINLCIGCQKNNTVNNELSSSDVSYKSSDEFEGVVITLDNYKDYFEIREHFYAPKDEFGDYIEFSLTYGTYLCLRNEYEIDTSYGKSNLKVKFECTNSVYGFDFNKETGEWKILDVISNYKDVYSVTEQFYDTSNEKELSDLTYAACIDSRTVGVWPNKEGGFGGKYKYSVDRPENINITGITGTIYIRSKK